MQSSIELTGPLVPLILLGFCGVSKTNSYRTDRDETIWLLVYFGRHFQTILHTLKGFSRGLSVFFPSEINTSMFLVEYEAGKLKKLSRNSLEAKTEVQFSFHL